MNPVIHVTVGTAGHIDHGKTALVKLLTGCDTDRLPEEKARGMTIDLGFATCALPDGRRVGIVDVPGHERFIHNMVAGVTGIDVVLLVVAADDGVMPQTIEHFHIVRLLGVQRGLVAITKSDLVEPARLAEVAQQIRELATGSFLESAPMLPVSSKTGAGFDAFYDAFVSVVAATAERRAEGASGTRWNSCPAAD
jgi:selenocysteine-specific elongation factor